MYGWPYYLPVSWVPSGAVHPRLLAVKPLVVQVAGGEEEGGQLAVHSALVPMEFPPEIFLLSYLKVERSSKGSPRQDRRSYL